MTERHMDHEETYVPVHLRFEESLERNRLEDQVREVLTKAIPRLYSLEYDDHDEHGTLPRELGALISVLEQDLWFDITDEDEDDDGEERNALDPYRRSRSNDREARSVEGRSC